MTLDKYISEKHSLENSVEIAYRVSAAIELLHRNERAHGTLKPENIYLNG
jgi:tRNA A-37 threonylcarbamoyl transferase component Bud32